MPTNTPQLIKYLLGTGHETESLEFKQNFDKEAIGQRISAIANTCAILDKDFGYIIFGIEDKTLHIIGTDFNPYTERAGSMPIENWLQQHLQPKIDFSFETCVLNDKKIVLLKILRAIDRPISFNNQEWIRIGEVTRLLKEFPEKEKQIWTNDKNKKYEKGVVVENLTESEVLQLLDYDAYFQLTKQEIPSETKLFLEKMAQDKLVKKTPEGNYDITFLGAIVFARNVQNISIVARKTVRVIQYSGNDKVKRENEKEGLKGYAVGFEGLVEYIQTLLPKNEEIDKALRVETKTYPEVVIREFVANALIHQDFSISGAGPIIVIFDNRIEITNPGRPLIEVDRFIDHPARSRNEDLAGMMRRLGFCEESGSGIDRALISIELHQLPAPKFEMFEDFTRVTLLAPLSLSLMNESDKIRACYQHSVLRYLSRQGCMTNTTLRDRLGIEESNYPAASKIIKSCIEKGFIKESEKSKEYIPWWA